MNATGALAGMLAGGFGMILFGFILKADILVDVYEILPGFICGVIGVVLGSLLGKKPSTAVIEDFNLMLKKVREI